MRNLLTAAPFAHGPAGIRRYEKPDGAVFGSGGSYGIPSIAQPEADPMVDREPARTNRKQGDGQACPIEVEIHPTVGEHQLNHARHDKKGKGRETCRKPQDEQDREHYFGNGNQERQHVRRWEIVDSAEDVKLELILKEIERPCGKRQKTIPSGKARTKERKRERDPQQRRRNDPRNRREPSKDGADEPLESASRQGIDRIYADLAELR